MGRLKIHFLNTIWSDAILLEKNGHYAFIDTGSTFYYPMITKYLNTLNIKEIDFILLTHFHSDHYGNIKNIINDYNVHSLYLKHYYGLDGTTASGFTSNEEYIENEFKNYYGILDKAKANNVDIVFFDDVKKDLYEINFENTVLELYDANNRLYELYNDPKSEYYNQKKFNENFNSIGIFIKENGYNVFLGGDVTCSKTDITSLKTLSIRMIERIYKKHNISSIDLYKSCHHGGGSTNTKELCDLLKARNIIITNTSRWLDTYNTFDNLRNATKNPNILLTDYYKYIFEIGDKLTYQCINEESLFITLKKN